MSAQNMLGLALIIWETMEPIITSWSHAQIEINLAVPLGNVGQII